VKVYDVVQGTAEWLALRSRHYCASDAPAMMGASKKVKRSELVHMKATGDEKQFTEWEKEHLLEKGHTVEPLARAIVEEMFGIELFPATVGTDDERLLASLDGSTMDGDDLFEHKLWNAELAEAVRLGNLPAEKFWQLEQQLLVTGAKRVIFVCSDGTREKFVHMEYRPVIGRSEQLLAGWKQFAEDVANYKPVEMKEAPRGRVIKDLPALDIRVQGKVLKSNIDAFRTAAESVIAAISTDLKTDQDFADAGEMVKFCEGAEKKLELVKEAVLGQTASIDEIFRTIDHLKESLRGKRLNLDKQVESRKKEIRAEILAEGQKALREHIDKLNVRLGGVYVPPSSIPVDFATAMKGKKTIAGLHDAVATELARVKILANELADRIGINLNTVRELAADHQHLFPDLGQIVGKENADFANVVKLRIAEEKQRAAERQAQQPAPAATEAVVSNGPGKVVSLRPPKRPNDADLIRAVASTYNVTEAVAVEWLRTLDLSSYQQPAVKG
jgi:predicted phage-related endonuclease